MNLEVTGMAMAVPAFLGCAVGEHRVQCRVCPHECTLSPGMAGVCGVRANRNDQLVNLVYGRVVAQGVEPVEKKPIFHFHPGHRTFSLAAAGCNLRCAFCQNWEISQVVNPTGLQRGRFLLPQDAVRTALDAGCDSICFTFTEAAVNLEYVLDLAPIARAAGLPILLLTGGYISDAALDRLIPVIDCVKIDLKGSDDDQYRRVVGGRIDPVVNAFRRFSESTWTEVSTVILPGVNDDARSIHKMAELILDVAGPDIPWHIMRFFPSFRMSGTLPGRIEQLRGVREIAISMGLRYVYISNVPGLASAHTRCPMCDEVVIRRGSGSYVVNALIDSCCPCCDNAFPGVGLGKTTSVGALPAVTQLQE